MMKAGRGDQALKEVMGRVVECEHAPVDVELLSAHNKEIRSRQKVEQSCATDWPRNWEHQGPLPKYALLIALPSYLIKSDRENIFLVAKFILIPSRALRSLGARSLNSLVLLRVQKRGTEILL